VPTMRRTQSIKASYGSRGQRLASVDNGIRRVAPTFGKVLYRTYSTKSTGQLVESDEERLVAHMLTLDPRVRAFKSQPFKVDLIDRRLLQTPDAVIEARIRHKDRHGPKFYTPDFAVDRHSATRSAIEVKREGYDGDDDYKSVLKQAGQILESAGYLFFTAMMPASPHPLRSNLPLLKKAASRSDLWPSPDLVQRIDAVCAGGHVTLRALCAELHLSPNLIPALLVSGAVSADVAAYSIQGDMVLAAASGDLSHLELLERVML